MARSAPLQTINYTKFDRTKDITEGDYKLTLQYGPYKNRKKTVLENTSTNGIVYNRYYSGGYEKTVDGSGNTQEVHYISCGNGITVAYVIDGGVGNYHYLHTDYLGSILAMSDASGTLEYEQNFDAWGRDRNPDDWTYTTSTTYTRPTWLYRGYTGHEHLREFTLINMNARMYDPETGRMLAVDNYVYDATNSQDYNRYSYARNNPLRYTDPSGESVVLAGVIIGAVVGAYLGGASANSTFNVGKWDFQSSTTWIGMGTGALIGAGTGALGTSGQLSYAIGTSIAGVSIGGIALNNSGSSYDLNLFAGSSNSGYNYNLGSTANRKYNADPFASNDAYVDYASLPPANPRGTAGALITEFTDAEYLQMGKTEEQIRHYRENGQWLTADDVATAMSAVGVLQNGVKGLLSYANALPTDVKLEKLMRNGGRLLGVPGAAVSIADALQDPSAGAWVRAGVNTAAIFGGPYSGAILFTLDQLKVTDKIYKGIDDAMDRITW